MVLQGLTLPANLLELLHCHLPRARMPVSFRSLSLSLAIHNKAPAGLSSSSHCPALPSQWHSPGQAQVQAHNLTKPWHNPILKEVPCAWRWGCLTECLQFPHSWLGCLGQIRKVWEEISQVPTSEQKFKKKSLLPPVRSRDSVKAHHLWLHLQKQTIPEWNKTMVKLDIMAMHVKVYQQRAILQRLHGRVHPAQRLDPWHEFILQICGCNFLNGPCSIDPCSAQKKKYVSNNC